MDHSYRSSRFDRLVVESGRLVTETADHERALRELQERLERHPPPRHDETKAPPASGTIDGVVWSAPNDLSATMQRLRAAARQHHQRAETLHAGLRGEFPAGRPPDPRPPVVLVVDDASDSVETVALFLELSGFHTITATNGLEALIAAHYARPDVAVLDLAMPVLNGLEAARLLKASAITRNTRLLAYTANWASDDSALREVFTEVLTKPARADEFLAAVRQLAGGAQPS
jgi:CheY-like chemotaxis protein